MGAMGWSFGGYMMDWFEGHTDRFKAMASMMGLYDLRSFYGATEELWFPEWDLKGQPWDSPLYEKFSPSNFGEEFQNAGLVITGERDYPRSLHAVAAFLHRAAEDECAVAPDRAIPKPDTGRAGTRWRSTTPRTSSGSTNISAARPPPWTTERFSATRCSTPQAANV